MTVIPDGAESGFPAIATPPPSNNAPASTSQRACLTACLLPLGTRRSYPANPARTTERAPNPAPPQSAWSANLQGAVRRAPKADGEAPERNRESIVTSANDRDSRDGSLPSGRRSRASESVGSMGIRHSRRPPRSYPVSLSAGRRGAITRSSRRRRVPLAAGVIMQNLGRSTPADQGLRARVTCASRPERGGRAGRRSTCRCERSARGAPPARGVAPRVARSLGGSPG